MEPSRSTLAFVRMTAAVATFAAAAVAQSTSRVCVDSSGNPGDSTSHHAAISADGTVVAFVSDAGNLVNHDKNYTPDVFVHELVTGITVRVSVDSSGVAANGESFLCAISADGSFVAYESAATNLVANDTNGRHDIFVRDRITHVTERVSVDSGGVEGDGDSTSPSISQDGRYVAFISSADNLVANDTNGVADVFVHDRSTGTTELVSCDASGSLADDQSLQPSISADGRFVAYWSLADNLVANDTNGVEDVFVRDRSNGTTERASVDSSGAEGDPVCFHGPYGSGCSGSFHPSISGDGNFVAFMSYSDNLVANDTNQAIDAFVHDRTTGVTERVNVDSSGAQSSRPVWQSVATADGELVAFISDATDLTPDADGHQQVFVHDRRSGLTLLYSIGSDGTPGDSMSEDVSLSSDGGVVCFSSYSNNLVANDTSTFEEVFVHSQPWIDASWSNYGQGFPGTNGVPAFTARADPVIGQLVTLDLGNSSGLLEPGMLFVGFQRANLPSTLGGTLLVDPTFTQIVALPTFGATISATLPFASQLFGVTLDLQALELDPGAQHGVSFTPGLEVIIGA